MGIKSKTDLYLPEFNFQNQNGVYISDADFPSKLILVTFMYSNCKTECPSALNDLKNFENWGRLTFYKRFVEAILEKITY